MLHAAKIFGRVSCVVATGALLVWASPAQARVKKIVVDKKVSPAFDGASFGAAGQYETLAGRAFGELDPNDPHNTVITDIRLAPKNANGKVEYMATFFLVKPIDMSKSSHLMWEDVPNRGGRITIVASERNEGDIGLSAGWQGDNSGNTVPGPNNDYVVVPIAKNPDGSPVTGLVMGRIVNVSGPDSQTMFVQTNPMPYKPASLDTAQATLTTHVSESIEGVIGATATIPGSDWAWAKCTADHPFPGTPDPTQICVKGGFNPKLLYQVVFKAKDPYVLGIGFAAFRDMGSFFKNAKQDDEGTPNPVATQVVESSPAGCRSRVLREGASAAGIHSGRGQQESLRRRVADYRGPAHHDELAVRHAGRHAEALNPGNEGSRGGPPGLIKARGLPAKGILDRCTANNTCPKIIEHAGSAEVWDLNLTPGWVGTSADADIPLPANVRRYYISSTQHGGGNGSFDVNPAPAPACPSTNFGRGMFAANPVPHAQTVNALRVHFRNWVLKDIAPPPNRWPTLKDHNLVDPTKEAMGFPTIPGLAPTAPNGLMNPLLDYDWGPISTARTRRA